MWWTMPREKFNVNRLVYTLYTTKENEYINIMPREKFNVNRLVYTLYTTKENEYINIKIEGIRRGCSV